MYLISRYLIVSIIVLHMVLSDIKNRELNKFENGTKEVEMQVVLIGSRQYYNIILYYNTGSYILITTSLFL